MTVMTRCFEQLLVKQDERRTKPFTELFHDAVVDLSKQPHDLADQTTLLHDETAAWIPEVDGKRNHCEREEPARTGCSDSVVSNPVAVPEAEWDTAPTTRTAIYKDGRRSRKTGEIRGQQCAHRNAGDDIPMLIEEMLDRFCSEDGHHCDRRIRQYRRLKAVTDSTRRRQVGVG